MNCKDTEIKLKINLFNANTERPIKEVITLIHNYRGLKLKGVLNSYIEFMTYKDTSILKVTQSMIHISNEPYTEDQDKLHSQI